MKNNEYVAQIIPANGWRVRFMDTNEEEFTQPVVVWGLLTDGAMVGFCAYGRDGLVPCTSKFDDGRQFVGYLEDEIVISIEDELIYGEMPDEVDWVAAFVNECCDVNQQSDEFFAPVADLYAAYRWFCTEHELHPMKIRSFFVGLADMNFGTGRKELTCDKIVSSREEYEGSRRVRVCFGLRIKPMVRMRLVPNFRFKD